MATTSLLRSGTVENPAQARTQPPRCFGGPRFHPQAGRASASRQQNRRLADVRQGLIVVLLKCRDDPPGSARLRRERPAMICYPACRDHGSTERDRRPSRSSLPTLSTAPRPPAPPGSAWPEQATRSTSAPSTPTSWPRSSSTTWTPHAPPAAGRAARRRAPARVGRAPGKVGHDHGPKASTSRTRAGPRRFRIRI
jgi:hypothetical protein